MNMQHLISEQKFFKNISLDVIQKTFDRTASEIDFCLTPDVSPLQSSGHDMNDKYRHNIP